MGDRGKRWTAQEDKLLVRRYGTTSAAEIALLLGRPRQQIYQRARKLGLRRNIKPRAAGSPETAGGWTSAEDALLAELFLLRTYSQIADVLGRPVGQLYDRAALLGLGKKIRAASPLNRSSRSREVYFICCMEQRTLEVAGGKLGLTRERVRQLLEEYAFAIAAEPALLESTRQAYVRRHAKRLDAAELARRLQRAADRRPPADRLVQRRIARLKALGEALDGASVERRHPALFCAALAEYVEWEDALAGGASAWRNAYESRGWPEERIVQVLRERLETGLSLAAAEVRRDVPDLHRAICLSSHNYYQGLAQRGFDAEVWRDRRGRPWKWTAERIDLALRERIDTGRPLGLIEMSRELPGLVEILSSRHGGWYAALAHYGIDPEPWRRMQRWSEERIAQELQRRVDAGLSVRSGDVRRERSGLHRAVVVRHGSWYEGLASHGIDCERPFRRWWTQERIAQALQQRLDNGQSLTAGIVAQEQLPLYGAVARQHGGWYVGLAAHGIDPTAWRARQPAHWTEERVAGALRERLDGGQSMRHADVLRDDPGLLAAVGKRYGGWYAGLAQHGIDPEPWRQRIAREHWNGRCGLQREQWSEEQIDAALRRRIEQGLSLRRADVLRDEPSLVYALTIRGRDWYAALEQRGIDPTPWRGPPRQRWDEETIDQAIRRRLEQGQSLRYTDVCSEDRNLVRAVEKRHAGWYAGLEHHGIDTGQLSRSDRQQWTDQRIGEQLRRRLAAGLSLRYVDVRREECCLVSAMATRHSSWYAGLEHYGIDPAPWRRS